MNHNLDMAIQYLSAYRQDEICKEGRHTWSEWSAFTSGLVKDIRDRDNGMHRQCVHCRMEMPKSRKGEDNYVSWDELCGIKAEQYKKRL